MRALQESSRSLPVRELTSRQVQVLELVAKRRTLKQVAGELGISESAVNQHIKTLKLALGVNSLTELADVHRAMPDPLLTEDCRNSACINSGLPSDPPASQIPVADDLTPAVSFHDSISYRVDAPWSLMTEPRVVPEVLNGANSKWARATLMVALTIGLFAAVILGLGAAQGVSSALSAERIASTPK